MGNARTLAELAKQFGVSPGTIYVRRENEAGGDRYRGAY